MKYEYFRKALYIYIYIYMYIYNGKYMRNIIKYKQLKLVNVKIFKNLY